MRLAFQNGQAYVPGTYQPAIHNAGLGDTNNSWDSGLSENDPNSDLLKMAATLPSAAMTGAATANMLGGGTTGDVVGGIQAGIMAAAPFTGPAAPFVLFAASLIGPIASQFKGCGATCTQATTIANNAQQAAEKVFQQWNSTQVKYLSIQKAALAAMSDIWNYIYQSCQKIGGQGGSQCIADRQRGGKYDFFTHYVDPISNATDIVADPVAPSAISSIFSSTGGGLPMPLVLGGAGVIALLLLSGDGK